MSLVDRINIETRTIGGVPWQPWRNPYWKFNIGGPVHPAREVQGQETILGLAAVYSSVRYIADAIASLPIRVYRQLPDGSSQRIFSSMLLGSPVAGGGPQISGTLYDWLFEGSTAALLHGTAWGLVTNRGGIPGSDGLGLPTGISWLPPERMSVQDDEMQPENPLRARIYYNGRMMERSELVQLKAFSVPGRVEGISPVKAFAMLWSQGLDALKYSAEWFMNGGFPPGTFRNINEEVDEPQAKEIRRRLTDTIRLRQPLVFGRDWEYREITVPPNEAAFIQAMQLNATQVAAIFGVRPQRVGGTQNDGLHYTSQVMDQLDEVTNTLRPWLTRWEHLLTSLLPATQYAKFDVDALLKMDPRTRTEVYQIQRSIGTRTANEIRAEDDLPQLEGGDDPLPQPVLERMMATTRSIPKSFVPLVTLEADMISKLMLKIEAEHPELMNPVTEARPPLNKTPGQYLAGLMTQIRSEMRGHLDWGKRPSDPDENDTWAFAQAICNANKDHPSPRVRAAVQKVEFSGDPADAQEALKLIMLERRSGPLFGPPDAQAEESDRKSALTMLRAHEKLGHLTAEEASVRISRAGHAGTSGELAELFGDLPRLTDGMAPSVSRETFGPAELRASDDDRQRAREMLTAHAKAGRLREAELDERSRKAAEAVTCGDLNGLFTDLPGTITVSSSRTEIRTREDENRSGEPDQPLFGPAALTLLRERATKFDEAGQLAAMNGKAH